MIFINNAADTLHIFVGTAALHRVEDGGGKCPMCRAKTVPRSGGGVEPLITN